MISAYTLSFLFNGLEFLTLVYAVFRLEAETATVD